MTMRYRQSSGVIDVVRPPNDDVSPADRNTPHEWVLDEFAHARIVVVIVVTAEIRSHPVPAHSAAAYTARAPYTERIHSQPPRGPFPRV